MTHRTLSEIAEKMRDIDFTMLMTHAAGNRIAGRPMSTNSDVDYDGDSYFFTLDDTAVVREIQSDPNVALAFQGGKGLLGKPGIYINAEGSAELLRDKQVFAAHWHKNLDRWFEQGVDTPGLVMIKVHAHKLNYWDGMDAGEIVVP